MPNTQPGGPGYPFSSGSSPLICLVLEALPVAYATASIALGIIWPYKPRHYVKVGIPSGGALLPYSPESTHSTFGAICPHCFPSWADLLYTVVCYTTFKIFKRIPAKHDKLIAQITLWNVADFCVSHRTCVTRGPYTVSISPPLEAMTRCHMATSSVILLS